MNLKLNLTALFILCLASTALQAQDRDSAYERGERGHRGPPSPEQRVLRMSEVMDLSSDQISGLLEIFKTAEDEMEILREQARRQIQPGMCAIHHDTEDKVASILYEEQLAELAALKAQHRGKRGQHGNRRDPAEACKELDDSSA